MVIMLLLMEIMVLKWHMQSWIFNRDVILYLVVQFQVATLNALYQVPTKYNMYKPATQSLLTANDVASKATYESTLNHVDSTSYTNNYILVNLSKQRVYIFYGTDHNWKLINTFSCGSGAVATPTVTGHFRVGVKGLYFKSGLCLL